MAFQFAHVEGYGRAPGKGKKGGHSLASIVAEAERQPGACPHIDQPREPRIVYGVAPAKAARIAQEWAEGSTDSRGHKLRKDALCMIGGVVSLPAGMAARWEKFSHESVKWLRHEYGKRLLSVVEHHDEAHPHLHFYVVPLKGERFSAIHAGLAAAERADPRRGDRTRTKTAKTQGRKMARDAYAEAMRRWQDRFGRVAQRFGLARIGPKRRRMTRDEYKAENAAREALAAQEAALAANLNELVALRDTLTKERVAVQRQVDEARRQATAWCAERDKVADREAYQRLKKRLPPQLARALEASEAREDRGR